MNPKMIRSMKAFTRTVELKSMSAAASELHMTVSAVSQQLRKLEKDNGLALFHRNTRGVTVGFQSTESYIPFIKKPQTVAGLLISTIYTKAATLTFYGRCLSMSSHWPPFYFQ